MNINQDPKEKSASKDEASEFDAALEKDVAILDQIALDELNDPEVFNKLNGDDDEQW